MGEREAGPKAILNQDNGLTHRSSVFLMSLGKYHGIPARHPADQIEGDYGTFVKAVRRGSTKEPLEQKVTALQLVRTRKYTSGFRNPAKIISAEI
jgi:hypothetical protein